jgi:tetratricopeptide (TPR) repeat protein
MSGKIDRIKITENAERLIKSGRSGEAVAEYEKLLDGSAQDIPTRNILADLHIGLGHEERAVKIFRGNVAALENQGSYSQALALCKRIIKLVPGDVEILIKMGDLYSALGFMVEAKQQYGLAAEAGDGITEPRALAALYEKVIGLDRADLETRLKLARLLINAGQIDRAASELNETAEVLLGRGEAAEAGRILQEARKIKDGDARTLGNLARVLGADHRGEEAIAMVEEIVARRGARADLLALLGDLLLNARQDARAAEIFDRLLTEDPDNADARAKRGVLELRAGRPEAAFTLYEPLVVSLLKRSKDGPAVGLLGLILFTNPTHRPSLEKLASIFRRSGRSEALAVVLRTLFKEAERQKDAVAVRALTAELAEICPDDADVQKRWKAIRDSEPKTDGPSMPGPPGRAPVLPEKDQDIIHTNLAKVGLYVEQGLVRNARRILENLMLLYPDDPRIVEQYDRLPRDAPAAGPIDVARLVDRIIGREAAAAEPAPEADAGSEPVPEPVPEPVLEPVSEPAAEARTAPRSEPPVRPIPEAAPAGPPEPRIVAPPEPSPPERPVSDTVSLDEIFGGIDLSSDRPDLAPEVLYPDLTAKIREELDAIETAFYRQIKERTSSIEKDLGEIVVEFMRRVDEKIERTDSEARYALGVAFLEQSLYDEAAAEFHLAAQDPAKAADCFALIGQCWKRRRNFREALRWIDEALRLVTAGTDPDYALTYERAELLEDLGENVQALEHFRRVKSWNAKYRDVGKRVKILEKIA